MNNTTTSTISISEKVCSKCGETKPVDQYRYCKTGRYGLRANCKDCDKASKLAYIEKNPNASRDYMRKRRSEHPEFMREQRRAYRKANPHKDKQYWAKYYSENKEYLSGRSSEWKARKDPEFAARKADRDKMAELGLRRCPRCRVPHELTAYLNKVGSCKTCRAEVNRLYREANPGKVCDIASRRRANARGNGIYFIRNSFMQKLYESPCVACGSTNRIQADHVIPIARGGRHSEGNLQPLCKACNLSKHAKTMTEWKIYLMRFN